MSLEGPNDYGVTVKTLSAKASGLKKYTGTKKSNWIEMYKTFTAKIQISADDEDFAYITNIDSEFFVASKWTKIADGVYKEDENGTPFKFGQTSYYTRGKKNSHWLRVK